MAEVRPELPPLEFEHVVIDPGEVDEEIYFPDLWRDPTQRKKLAETERMVREVLRAAKGTDAKVDVLRALSGDSISRMRRWTGLAKCKPVVELVKNELESGVEKLVIFAIHRDVILTLRDLLRPYRPVILFGGTPDKKREAHIKKFSHEGGPCRVFIGQVHAAGTNISLAAAHDVWFAEQHWTPGPNAQAAMRCHHIEQQHPVHVRFIGLEGSIDKVVSDILLRKTRDMIAIFG